MERSLAASDFSSRDASLRWHDVIWTSVAHCRTLRLMPGGWVSIMANKPHGVLYVGVTANLVERIAQHRVGNGGSKFARKYNCTRLVYAEPHGTILDAIAREKAMKAWPRLRHKVSIGDQGHPAVTARMRTPANFAENMPIFLILLFLIEHAVGSEFWLWLVAIAFILARLLHVFGMARPGANWLRVAGISISWLVILGLAACAIFLSYSETSSRRALDAPQLHRAEAPRI